MTKAQDFNSSLAEQQVMDALYEEKYAMQSALSDALDDICEDEALLIAEKKLQVTKSYGQFGAAMSEWWGRFLDATTDDPGEMDDMGKEEKAGRAISAGTASQLNKAAGHLQDSVGYAKMAGSSRSKAIGVLAELKKAYFANDINVPNPVGGGKEESDPEILHSLLKASRTVKAMR